MTVTEFKRIVADWPEIDHTGEPTEVFMTTGRMLSSPVVEVEPLNERRSEDGTWTSDMLIHTPLWDDPEGGRKP